MFRKALLALVLVASPVLADPTCGIIVRSPALWPRVPQKSAIEFDAFWTFDSWDGCISYSIVFQVDFNDGKGWTTIEQWADCSLPQNGFARIDTVAPANPGRTNLRAQIVMVMDYTDGGGWMEIGDVDTFVITP